MGLIHLKPKEGQTPQEFADFCAYEIDDYRSEDDVEISSVHFQWCDANRLALFYTDGFKCWTPPLESEFYDAAEKVFLKYSLMSSCMDE